MRFPFSVFASSRRAEKRLSYLECLALALMIFGARLWLIANYGSPLPILDQWDGEAAMLFKPFLEGTLRFADLFAPHNEHRLVLSRLLALALLRLNGQWDSLVEMTINAAICAMIAVAVAATLVRWFETRSRTFILIAVTLWGVLPYAQENTLWGFQSSFYFLLFFSLLAIWGLGFHHSSTVGWWLGAVALVLAPLSMASGFFAAIVVLGLMAARLMTRRASLRDSVATAILCLVITALSAHFRVIVPYHEMYKAASPLAWLTFLGKCLAWPFCDAPIASCVMYMPLGILAISYLVSRRDRKHPIWRGIELLGAIGAWSVLQAAAIAYTRGGDGSTPVSSRYMDILALGAIANALAVLVLVDRARGNFVRRTAQVAVAMAWTIAVVIGSIQISRQQVRGQMFRQGYLRNCEESIRAYIATGDRRKIDDDPQPPIPYPRSAGLISILDEPSIRTILPAVVIAPLRTEKSQDVGNAFVPNGYPPELQNASYERGWGSYSGQGVAARGGMQSQELRPRLHYLRFEVAGHLPKETSLRLESSLKGRVNRIPAPKRSDGSWRVADVAVPDDSVRVVAEDDDAARWFGFREPRELGRYSYYSLRLIRQGQKIFVWGVVLGLVLVARHPFGELRNVGRMPGHKKTDADRVVTE